MGSAATTREPIRVLRLIARLNVGGPALHVSYLTKGLTDRGYETTLVAGSIGQGEGSMEYVAESLGIETLFVPELQREIAFGDERRAVGAVLDLLRMTRPHILHTHTAKAGAIGRMAALMAGRHRPPVVVHTFHGHVLRGYFGHARTAAFRLIERSLARNSDALIAVSPQVRDDLVALGVASAAKIAVVRLGLDLSHRARPATVEGTALRAELGISADRAVVAWLGRMTEIKRVDDLLAAVARLREGGTDADLLLVGDGPLRTKLEAQAARLGLSGHAHFAGFREDVAAVYAAADVVALTSANEGTPVTAIEALASGRPVVSTAVGGVPDVVTDGETGFLVRPGDVEGIAERLARLAADPSLRQSMGGDGRERIPRRFAVPRLIADMDDLYRSLLEANDPGRRRVYGPIGRPLPPAIRPVQAIPPRPRKTLRVALFTQYFAPEVGATQSRMQAFADALAARGHEVTVVCEFPNHPHGIIPGVYSDRLVEDDRSNAYRILRVWVRASVEKTQRSRMEFYLSYMAMATGVAPRIGRPDVIVATSPPLFAGMAGAIVARLSRAPLVLDVRDLWPAAAISLGQLSHPVAERASKMIEHWLYREAAAVLGVTRPFCDYIDLARGRPPATAFVPNGTLPQFLEASADGARAHFELPTERFVATFAGNLGIAQSLGTVLDAAARVQDSVDVVFVGDGPLREQLMEIAAERNLANVHFREQVPLDEVAPLLAASDALLVTLAADETFADFVPSKMIDCMAAGRPVVLAASGEAARILSAADAGVVVQPEDPVALADTLEWLVCNPEEAERLGANGRIFASRRTREAQAERLEALLWDVVRGSR